ncbi:hypothetical protein GCM10010960_14700 [Arenimonas maotaiensis]|uniref:Uncharacterized protein n=1 Tax=Arenimonas maotaiensis TaxID=1446479 RepID=A0A917CPD6_9GAMM|nr:hypothetical protein [Arenimonas maotaiensis]GGF93981.1 hypothetical protein GCM10010960_14700 [Arenimonas maotaiensis]
MYLLYFALSLGCLVAAFIAEVGVGGVGFLLLMTALFGLMGAWNLIRTKVEGQRRPERHIISAEELRQLREQAEQAKARKAAEKDGGEA